LEAAASRSAVVASPTTYGATIGDGNTLLGRRVGVVVENDADRWASTVLGLVAEPERRQGIAMAGRAFVERHHTMEQTKVEWRSAVERALGA
jgi:glycosyltransferase involved in cell wall biosynthesis